MRRQHNTDEAKAIIKETLLEAMKTMSSDNLQSLHSLELDEVLSQAKEAFIEETELNGEDIHDYNQGICSDYLDEVKARIELEYNELKRLLEVRAKGGFINPKLERALSLEFVNYVTNDDSIDHNIIYGYSHRDDKRYDISDVFNNLEFSRRSNILNLPKLSRFGDNLKVCSTSQIVYKNTLKEKANMLVKHKIRLTALYYQHGYIANDGGFISVLRANPPKPEEIDLPYFMDITDIVPKVVGVKGNKKTFGRGQAKSDGYWEQSERMKATYVATSGQYRQFDYSECGGWSPKRETREDRDYLWDRGTPGLYHTYTNTVYKNDTIKDDLTWWRLGLRPLKAKR
tara:strand:+ start:1430 stop:2458 length:1029 start_codon:yes stop_codon:yes gene_type:complete